MSVLAEALDRPNPMAVTFTQEMPDEVIANIAIFADVAEFRADKFPHHSEAYLAGQARKLCRMPVLLTVRWTPERGSWRGTELQRFERISCLSPHVHGFDIELDAEEIRSDV